MGKIILIMLVLIFLLCFSIYNSWFQKEKMKRMFDHEIKKISPFNSYKAWAIYAVVIALAIFSVMGYEIYVLMDTIKNSNL